MPGSHRGRPLVLVVLLVATAMGYAVLTRSLSKDAARPEQRFAAAAPDGGGQLGIYVEALSIDPVNETVRLRISPTPTGTPGQAARGAGPELRLQFGEGSNQQELLVHGQQPAGEATMAAELHGGAVADYPFDRFRATLRLAAQDGDTAGSVPLVVTIWERIEGWVMVATPEPDDVAGAVRLRLDVRRSRALAFLVLAVYGGMALVGCAALLIGAFVFLRLRAADAELIGALVAMLFALPALRSTLPGAPPLGVRADLAVFVWAELAVTLGLALLIVAWAQDGSRR